MKIDYNKDGDIVVKDDKTGVTVGHITTIGNMIEETKEDKERNKKEIEKIKKKFDIK